MAIVGMDGITLFDVKDSLESGTPPANPVVGQLWVDSSVTPYPMVKSWNGAEWENLGELNADLSGELDEINQQLTAMTDDNLIDLKERIILKSQINEIIGLDIADTAMILPTVAEMDSVGEGSFASVRQSAINSGIETNHADYVGVATEYNDLKTYLDGLTPIKIWDTSDPNRNQAIVVNRNVFRDTWLSYRIAVNKLEVATAEQLKKNADNIQVGGRNYVRNALFNKFDPEENLLDWRDVNPIWEVLEPESDKPNSSILHAVTLGNTTSGYYSIYSNTFPVRIGDVLTFSVDFKVADETAWDVKEPLIAEFYDSTGTRVYFDVLTVNDMVSNEWKRISYTTTVSDTTVVSASLRFIIYKNGDVYYREPQVERGNKMTDFMIAPEDSTEQIYLLENRVSNAEQKISDSEIISTVMEATVFQDILDKKADADSLGSYIDSDALNQALADEQKTVDNKIADIDFSPYALQSDVEQTAKDLTVSFSKSGGINVLRNSVGYADFITKAQADAGVYGWFRQGATERASRIQSGSIEALGYNFNSGFRFTPVTTDSNVSIDQYVTVIPNQAYTLSFYVNKTNESDPLTNDGRFSVLLNEDGVIKDEVNLSGEIVTNGFEKRVITYTPTTNKLQIRLYGYKEANVTITALMLNIGFEAFSWTASTGEVMNTNVKFDFDGIEVSKYENNEEMQRTIMTPDRFAGFYDVDNDGVIDDSVNSPDEVFRIDKDEFVQKKAVIREEITMGTLKVIEMQTPVFTGWVWVSNQTS